MEPEPTPPVSSQATSEVVFPLGRDREDPTISLDLEEAQAKSIRNSAPVMGLLRQGFLGSNFVSSSIPRVSQVFSSPLMAPISSVSMSQLAYSQRVKEKVAKQLHKNKELLAEAVVDT